MRLYELFTALEETATSGASCAGGVATVANPSKKKKSKRITKNKPGQDVGNANLFTGEIVKR